MPHSPYLISYHITWMVLSSFRLDPQRIINYSTIQPRRTITYNQWHLPYSVSKHSNNLVLSSPLGTYMHRSFRGYMADGVSCNPLLITKTIEALLLKVGALAILSLSYMLSLLLQSFDPLVIGSISLVRLLLIILLLFNYFYKSQQCSSSPRVSEQAYFQVCLTRLGGLDPRLNQGLIERFLLALLLSIFYKQVSYYFSAPKAI